MAEDFAEIDFETRGSLDLTKTGVYRYSEHPDTWVWMLSWKLASGPRGRWHPGEPDPAPLLDHVRRGGRVVAHNANFERQVWNTTLRPRGYGHWPRLEIEQMDCTLARALAVHLPAELGQLSEALGLGSGKDPEGRALMLKMARPRKRLPDGTLTWWDDPDMVRRLGELRCDRDVEVESRVNRLLPPLSPEERRLWELDQRINDRGIAVDVTTVRHAVGVLEVAQGRANARMAELTDGTVRKCSEAGKLVTWLQSRGVPCESVGKDEHEELKVHADFIGDEAARQAVELRAQAAKNSTAKFRRMLDVVCDDGRARGLLQYHRALTGRWGGALVQPHNLPRVDPDLDLPGVLAAIETMDEFS